MVLVPMGAIGGGMSREGGNLGRRSRHGRPRKIQGEVGEALRAIVEAHPLATIQELADRLAAETGVRVERDTMYRTLARLGIQRVRPSSKTSRAGSEGRGAAAAEPAPSEPRYGYRDHHRIEPTPERYPTDVTDAEWRLIEPIFEQDGPGRPERYRRRTLFNAISYVVRTGCPWRSLPKDFPPWQNVYATFRRWSRAGVFEQVHDRLRAMWREREGRANGPSGALLDTQSVRSSENGGPHGFDAGKKVKGRKRHLVTDTLGLLLAVVIHSADIQDRDGAARAFAPAKQKYPSIQTVWVDAGYGGQCARELSEDHAVDVEVVRRASRRGAWHTGQAELFELPKGFVVQAKRWVIERTNGWTDHVRRMAKDYDRLTEVSATWVWLVHARRMMASLAAAN